MELQLIQVEIACIDDEPQVTVTETGEALEVSVGNFDNAIFVKYLDEEYLVETEYPCWEGGAGYLRLRGTPQRAVHE